MKRAFALPAFALLVAMPTMALADHEAEVKNAFKMANDNMMQGMMGDRDSQRPNEQWRQNDPGKGENENQPGQKGKNG